MKNYKQLIIGIVIGSFAGCAAVIAGEYVIAPNPYPVTINGTAAQIEGYNINDKTYFQLRDIGDKVGFEVAFKDNTINVTTPDSPSRTPTPTQTPTPTALHDSATNTPNPALGSSGRSLQRDGYSFTSDGLPIEAIDGKKYVSTVNIEFIYSVEKNGYGFGQGVLYDKDFNRVFENITTAPDSYIDIQLDYYETTLRPFLQQYCK